MALSTNVKTKRDGTIRIFDGGSGGSLKSLTVSLEDGNFTYSITPSNRAVLDIRDRGVFAQRRFGDDASVSGSFSVHFTAFTDNDGTVSEATIHDIIANTGYFASTWVTRATSGSSSDAPKEVRLVYVAEGSDHGDTADHIIGFDNVILTGSFSEGDPSKITVNFTSYNTTLITALPT